MKTDRSTERDAQRDVREFCHKDAKGRLIGARAYKYTVDYTPNDSAVARPSWRGGYDEAPGTRYGYKPHALRDGRSFGSSHGHFEFDSAAERDAAVEKYFREAEKRARKLADA